ncbi:UNVERIFIED_CONTAM: hypothetical protein FKN15_022363 [Acipenser sinensis]
MSLPSTMYISSLPHRYSAAQLHLHWGSTDHLGGSEHTINGKQYPAEMHVVHFNSDKYSNLSTAVDKADGLAVLGVFIDVGAFNPVFDHILSHLGSVRYRGKLFLNLQPSSSKAKQLPSLQEGPSSANLLRVNAGL